MDSITNLWWQFFGKVTNFNEYLLLLMKQGAMVKVIDESKCVYHKSRGVLRKIFFYNGKICTMFLPFFRTVLLSF
jgi:hypothetical protein